MFFVGFFFGGGGGKNIYHNEQKHRSVVVDMLLLWIEQYQIKINILNITSICQPTVSKSSPEVKIKNKVYLYIIKSTKAKKNY